MNISYGLYLPLLSYLTAHINYKRFFRICFFPPFRVSRSVRYWPMFLSVLVYGEWYALGLCTLYTVQILLTPDASVYTLASIRINNLARDAYHANISKTKADRELEMGGQCGRCKRGCTEQRDTQYNRKVSLNVSLFVRSFVCSPAICGTEKWIRLLRAKYFWAHKPNDREQRNEKKKQNQNNSTRYECYRQLLVFVFCCCCCWCCRLPLLLMML